MTTYSAARLPVHRGPAAWSAILPDAERPVVRMVADSDGHPVEAGPEVDLAEKTDDDAYRFSIVQLVDNAAYQFDTSRYFV